MAKLSRLENGHWAIDTESTIPQINALQIFYRSGDTGILLKQQSILGSRIIYADGTGASHIVPSATNNEPLTLVILDSSNNLILEEIVYFSSNIFTEYLDLAGANFNPTWNRLNYNKTKDIAVFSKIYNEFEFVEIFLKHYSELTHPSNIYLIDHSSENTGFYQLAERYGCQVIKIPRGETDETNMKSFCEYFQRFLLTKYSWVIYADIDELLVHRSGAEGLRKLLIEDEWRGLYAPEFAYEIYHEPNKEPEFDFSKKITLQREYLVSNKYFHKPTVTSAQAFWGTGFHEALNSNARKLKDLWLIHINYISATYRVKREFDRGKEIRSETDSARGVSVERFEDPAKQYDKVKSLFLNRIYGNDDVGSETIKMPEWMIGRF